MPCSNIQASIVSGLYRDNQRHTDFPPVKRVDPTGCAVVNQDVSRPVIGGNSSEQINSILLKKYQRMQVTKETIKCFMGLSNLLNACDPEYQAAARVALMTTSTGTRSATASLDALIVRRIPLPAWTTWRKDYKWQLIRFPRLYIRMQNRSVQTTTWQDYQ